MPRRARRGSTPDSDLSTREKILETAEALIAEHGVEGFQIKDLAAEIGIRAPSLFGHFGGRDAIIEAVAVRLLDNIARVTAVDEEDPVAALRRCTGGLVRYLAENRAAARLLMREIGRPGSAGVGDTESTRSRLDAIQNEFAAVLRRGVRKGVFRRVRPEAVMAQLVGAATANVVWLDDGDRPPPGLTVRKLERETTELILRYVARDEPGHPA